MLVCCWRCRPGGHVCGAAAPPQQARFIRCPLVDQRLPPAAPCRSWCRWRTCQGGSWWSPGSCASARTGGGWTPTGASCCAGGCDCAVPLSPLLLAVECFSASIGLRAPPSSSPSLCMPKAVGLRSGLGEQRHQAGGHVAPTIPAAQGGFLPAAPHCCWCRFVLQELGCALGVQGARLRPCGGEPREGAIQVGACTLCDSSRCLVVAACCRQSTVGGSALAGLGESSLLAA